MAFSGKKGKKNKGTVISLQSFLSNDDAPVGTTQVAKNIRNVDGDDSDDGENVLTLVCHLPTAPRANRVFDDNSVPHRAPFIAYITNLPFDVKEDDIYEYFSSNRVTTVRLPREDGESGRVRGFGYVEFETREDLIQSLGIPDPTIKGRRIRIDLSNENDQNSKQRGNRRGYDNSNSENRDSTDWRRDNTQNRETNNYGFDRGSSRDSKSAPDNNSTGSWRMGSRSTINETSSTERTFERKRDVRIENKNDMPQERPKLVLKPRTLPLPELEVAPTTKIESKVDDATEEVSSLKFTGVPAEKVFGSAKPVDTTARDLEIEERLLDIRRQENSQKKVSDSINNELNELSLEKEEKVSIVEKSWRRQAGDEDTSKGQDKQSIRSDRRYDNTRDNRYKFQEKTERSDNFKDSGKDGKQRKDGVKNKRDYKVERQLPKYTQNQSEPVLQSSNKYSGLDDASD